jgi:DNA modification methylase
MSGLSRLSHGSGMIVSGRTARPEVSVVPEGRNARGVSSLTRNRGQTNADTPNELRIEVIPISSLKPYERNARIHSANQIRDIAESMKKFGVTMPILIDRNRVLVAGHARLEALKLLGRERVHVISLENLTEAQVRAYRLADNKLSANSSWDDALLGIELREIAELDVDCDFSIPGFETGEIDFLVQNSDQGSSDESHEIPEIDETTPAVTHDDDLWILGKHRIYCGDARKPRSFERLMETHKAKMIFADPPYNVEISGNVSGLGRIKHKEFAMASGELSVPQFTDFLVTVFRLLAANSVDGSIHEFFMDWRHMREMLAASLCVYTELKNLCVWVKDNGGMGSLFRSRHELVFVFKNGAAPHINNVELGKHGRNRTNVWCYPGVNTMRAGRLEELAMHPTVKPVALVADAIMDVSHRGDIVLDCFGGSGTTLLAAEKTGRRGYLMDIESRYVDVTIERYRKFTGKSAVLEGTGLTFEQIKAERTAGGSR